MLCRIIVFCLCLITVNAGGEDVKYSLCTFPKGIGEVKAVRVDPCPPVGDGGCILRKNHTVVIEIDFVPLNNSDTLVHSVHGMIWGAPIPYAGIGGSDACSKLDGGSCPLSAGETYSYKSNFFVLPSYPTLSLSVRWQLISAETTIQVCVLIPVKIDV